MENKYCAFIKQIRVKNQFVRMHDIRALCENLELNNVRSVLSTGNIIFTSNDKKENICIKIKEALSKMYLFDIDVFVCDIDKVKNILINNPFVENKDYHIQTFICDNNFEETLINKSKTIQLTDGEQIVMYNSNLYWYCQKKVFFNSNFFKLISRNTIKHHLTLRTIGSIRKICDKI